MNVVSLLSLLDFLNRLSFTTMYHLNKHKFLKTSNIELPELEK